MVKANIKVGNSTIQIEEERPVDLVEAAGFWGECPVKCGNPNCGSESIGFFSRTPKGNLYVGMKCRECKYELNFGQNKEGGKLFIKYDEPWKAPYSSDNDGGGHRPAEAHNQPDDDDIPF